VLSPPPLLRCQAGEHYDGPPDVTENEPSDGAPVTIDRNPDIAVLVNAFIDELQSAGKLLVEDRRHPAVQLSPFRIVGAVRVAWPEPAGEEFHRCQALARYEPHLDRAGAPLREALVVAVVAQSISVSPDHHRPARLGAQELSRLV
jgi:hypothetical protein